MAQEGRKAVRPAAKSSSRHTRETDKSKDTGRGIRAASHAETGSANASEDTGDHDDSEPEDFHVERLPAKGGSYGAMARLQDVVGDRILHQPLRGAPDVSTQRQSSKVQGEKVNRAVPRSLPGAMPSGQTGTQRVRDREYEGDRSHCIPGSPRYDSAKQGGRQMAVRSRQRGMIRMGGDKDGVEPSATEPSPGKGGKTLPDASGVASPPRRVTADDAYPYKCFYCSKTFQNAQVGRLHTC